VPAPEKLAGIEAARGGAAALVVFYHAARHMDLACHVPFLRALLQFGHAGVDLFFVLSGFIILFVHFEDVGRPGRLGRYLSRRATRVLPVYWVALTLTILLAVVAGHGWPGGWPVVRSALLLPSWSEPLLGVAWTLQYEVVFYAFFAALILNRHVGILLLAAWLMAVLVASARGGLGVPPSVCSAYDLEFFLGMGVAVLARRGGVGASGVAVLVGGSVLVLVFACEDLGFLDGYGVWGRLAYGVPAATLILGLADPGFALPAMMARPLAMLGAASYAIYLFQFCWIALVWQVYRAGRLDHLLACGWGVPVLGLSAIAGGVMMSRCVEHPLMHLLRVRRAPRAAST
jgi:exopolysaccharide production protein ExoZ